MNNSKSLFKFDILTWTILALSALYVALVLFPSHLNHDVSWILYGSREMLNGGEFGRDVIDVNPPLTWWFSMPPMWVAELFNASPILVFRLYVFLLIGVSITLLRRTNKQLEHWQVAAAAMTLIVMPGYDFGQREHLMVILVVPYLGIAIKPVENEPASTRYLIGLLAGIGICIKPYFLLIPICVEIFRIVKTRSFPGIFRIETITMGKFGIAYVASALILAPAFSSDILSATLTNYTAFNNPLIFVAGSLVSKSILVLLALIVLILAQVRWRAGSGFLAAAFGAALSVLAQSKGWNYHILPVVAFVLLAISMSFKPKKKVLFYFVGMAFSCLAVFNQPARQAIVLVSPSGQHSLVNALSNRFSSLPIKKRKVFAFITSPRDIWPAMLDANAHWSGSQCCNYLLPAAVNNPDDKKTRANAERQLTAIVKTLEHEKPALIAVNGANYQLAIRNPGFDYIKYLRQRNAYDVLFKQYKETKSIGYFRIFERL